MEKSNNNLINCDNNSNSNQQSHKNPKISIELKKNIVDIID